MTSEPKAIDIAIIGAGAAGMAAGIFAAEAARGKDLRIVMIEGAKKPGAKILISGGGRCNVTNERVTPEDFCGGSRAIIRNVLAQFDDVRTRAWFESMGVRLKLEPTGKYFPVTDRAQTVLDALLKRIGELGIELWAGTRVVGIGPAGALCVSDAQGASLTSPPDGENQARAGSAGASPSTGFAIALVGGRSIRARRVIVATGGMALPKSGSDGAGLGMMERLGHTINLTTPALTGLVLRNGKSLGGRFSEFAGMSFEARLTLHADGQDRHAIAREGDLLFTHFGISGPVAMDMSRHWLQKSTRYPQDRHTLTMGTTMLNDEVQVEEWLSNERDVAPGARVSDSLETFFPSRFAKAMAVEACGDATISQLTRQARNKLCRMVASLPLDVIDTRGYAHAEAMAGGIELGEIDYRTMESRKVPGLFLCGEILDVDGRIGGFNFQWAWSSGYVAGRGAAG